MTVLAAAACSSSATSVTLPPPHPAGQDAQRCDRLGAALPGTLAGLSARQTEPRSSLTHAWGSPPVTLVCGVPAPAGYRPASTSTLSVDDVQWYEQVGADAVTWTAIRPDPLSRHRVYVALTVPKHYSQDAAFLTALARPLKSALS